MRCIKNLTNVMRGEGLRAKALRGSAWTFAGYAVSQILRLGSNLILTRMLFPEAFGLMALVNVFIQGLAMFSDVGIAPSIIRSSRGEERCFLDTAWTIQVVRGFVLFFAACAISHPVAIVYKELSLAYLVPLGALSAIIAGFNPTKLIIRNRVLDFKRLTILEVSTQALSILSTITICWFYPEVWSLVVGTLFGASAKLVLAHLMIPGEGNRFCWDKDCTGELFGFGKWIFVSTVLTFFARNMDLALAGVMLKSSQVGLYSVAKNIAMIPAGIITAVVGKVCLPVYSHALRFSADTMAGKINKASRLVLMPAVFAYVAISLLGEVAIELLYDERYLGAGNVLANAGSGIAFVVLATARSGVLMSLGRSKSVFLINVIATLVMAIAVPALGAFGPSGVMLAFACSVASIYYVQSSMVCKVVCSKRCFLEWVVVLVLTLDLIARSVVGWSRT